MTNKFNLEIELFDSKYCEGYPYFSILTSDFCSKLHKHLDQEVTDDYYEYIRDENCPLKPIKGESNDSHD